MEKTTRLAVGRAEPVLRTVGLCVLFAALISVGGHIRVPIPGNPVPVTLQVVFVLFAGSFLAPAAAAASVALFLAAGLAGAPIFAGGGAGLVHLFGPTGGYLVGFLAGAPICSFLIAGKRVSIARVVLSMASAILVIHLFGAAGLALYLGGDARAALRLGVVPFLWLDLIKTALAAAVVTGTSSLVMKSPAGRT